MNKILLSAALSVGLFTATLSSAQSTANSEFNIVLEDVMSLSINGNTTTTVTFDNINTYIDGVGRTIPDYLTVISTKAYKVTVKAGDLTTNPSGLVSNQINLAANPSDNSAGRTSNVTSRPVVNIISNELNLIVSSGSTYNEATQSAEALFNLDYGVHGGNHVFDKPSGTNIIPVVFTISAP